MKIQSLCLVFVATTLVGCASNQIMQTNAQSEYTEHCKVTSKTEIAALFDRWNQSLQTGDPHKVVAHYAEQSILLPTFSNQPRLTPAEKEDYFQHFLENHPLGKIDLHFIEFGCSGEDRRQDVVAGRERLPHRSF